MQYFFNNIFNHGSGKKKIEDWKLGLVIKTMTREKRKVIKLETVNDSSFDCDWQRTNECETAHLSY